MTSPIGRVITDTTIESYVVATDLHRQLEDREKLTELLAATALTYPFAGDPETADRSESEAQALLRASVSRRRCGAPPLRPTSAMV